MWQKDKNSEVRLEVGIDNIEPKDLHSMFGIFFLFHSSFILLLAASFLLKQGGSDRAAEIKQWDGERSLVSKMPHSGSRCPYACKKHAQDYRFAVC